VIDDSSPGGAAMCCTATHENPIKEKAADKNKTRTLDALVTRYYPTVHNFDSRLTDDPREAVLLRQAAFNSARRHLPTRRDQAALVIILLNAVIRGDFSAV